MTRSRPRRGTRILLVDDHVIFREGIKAILAVDQTVTIAGETGDPQAVVTLAAPINPDVILLDDDLAGFDGLRLITPLRAALADVAIIVISELRSPDVRSRALQGGAKGLISKGDGGDVLIKAIRQVTNGELWFDRGTVSAAVAALLDPGRPRAAHAGEPLTDREREIVALVGAGLKTEAIATTLSITQKTVRNQLTVIYEKLGVSDRLELAIYAYRHGLARVPS